MTVPVDPHVWGAGGNILAAGREISGVGGVLPDFLNTFDDADWLTKFNIESSLKTANLSQIAAPGGRSGSAMRISYAANGTADNDGFVGYGSHFQSGFNDLGLDYGGLEGGAEDITLEYDLWLPANFNSYEGGKLPGLAGRNTSGSLISSGSNMYDTSWSGRVMWKKPVDGVTMSQIRMICYLYVPQIGSQTIQQYAGGGTIYGFSYPWNADTTKSGTNYLYLNRGAWNNIKLRYVMNTPGVSDGIFQGSLNGVLGIDLSDVMYRKSGYPNMPANLLYSSFFFGGPTSNVLAQEQAVDDLTIGQGI